LLVWYPDRPLFWWDCPACGQRIADHGPALTPAVLAALTRSGLAAATRSLAIEYASLGIRVNAVSPGIIQGLAQPPESYEHLSPGSLLVMLAATVR
jgi:NAD(P)-dependent dehydrogenase (short-subunit alcohol dehydrogenase family)